VDAHTALLVLVLPAQNVPFSCLHQHKRYSRPRAVRISDDQSIRAPLSNTAGTDPPAGKPATTLAVPHVSSTIIASFSESKFPRMPSAEHN
jgi:hypothetical protein